MNKEAKKNGILVIIIISTIYILKTTSNLDYRQIGYTIILIWISFWASNKKNLIKNTVTPIWILGGLFLLGLGYLPLFQNTPSHKIFVSTQQRHIKVKSVNENSTILVKQAEFTKKQEIIDTEKEIIFKESPKTTITFSNKNINSSSIMTIQFPDQTIIVIYPNSSFSLQISGDQQIIDKIIWKMEYMTWTSNKIIINKAELKKISDFAGKWLWLEYQQRQRDFFLNQAWGIMMENQNIRQLIHVIITIASKIRPTKYLPYLENEKKYKEILQRIDEIPKNYENKNNKVTENIVSQWKNASSKTKFLQFLSK